MTGRACVSRAEGDQPPIGDPPDEDEDEDWDEDPDDDDSEDDDDDVLDDE